MRDESSAITLRRSFKNRLVVGGGRPVLLGQRNRMRMRRGVAMGVAELLVVDAQLILELL